MWFAWLKFYKLLGDFLTIFFNEELFGNHVYGLMKGLFSECMHILIHKDLRRQREQEML